jgi:hypothetical protein
MKFLTWRNKRELTDSSQRVSDAIYFTRCYLGGESPNDPGRMAFQPQLFHYSRRDPLPEPPTEKRLAHFH